VPQADATRLAHAVTPQAAVTLDGLLRERVARTPERVAYRYFDPSLQAWRDYAWAEIYRQVARWQAALEREALQPGDRVAIMSRNSPEWVIFDQAAMGLGLITVPLYTQDRAENAAYIVRDAGCRLLVLGGAEQWQQLAAVQDQLDGIARFVSVERVPDAPPASRLVALADWLPETDDAVKHVARDSAALATIVYTSGTTGRPKGVMLSHHNILTNAWASLELVDFINADHIFLSFLPLSHTFERTLGYYLAVMAGATVAYARSIPQLGEDLMQIRPTLLISVPRIYERVHGALRARLAEGPAFRRWLFDLAVKVGWSRFEHSQGRAPWRVSHLLWPLLERLVARKVMARLGGRLHTAMSGGAALAPDVARVFIGLGLQVLQGYGLTETSPVACANRPDDNLPASVGRPIRDVEVRIDASGALLIRGPNVMLGYWNNEAATRAVVDADGWLNSGDTARIDAAGHVFITGRLKEIIVLSNGEKIPPGDMEAAILRDPLFEQVMVIGEGRPFLGALAVLNADRWRELAAARGIDAPAPDLCASEPAEKLIVARIAQQITEFPGYAQVHRAAASLEPWSMDNGLLTPTLKVRRARVMEWFGESVKRIYGK
jgi:long-chain acyl-CoA synthetase